MTSIDEADRQYVLNGCLEFLGEAADQYKAFLDSLPFGDLYNFYVQVLRGRLIDTARAGAQTLRTCADIRDAIIDALVKLESDGRFSGHEPEPVLSAGFNFAHLQILGARTRRRQLEALSPNDLRNQCREMVEYQQRTGAMWDEHRAVESDEARKRARKRHDRTAPIQTFANDARLRGLSANNALRELENNPFTIDGRVVVLLKENELSRDRIVICRHETWKGKGTKEEIAAIRALVQTGGVPCISRRTFENRFWPKAKR
jgi:hypothetical protein